MVRFFQREYGVIVEAEIFGLPRTQSGFFAFHIHDGTDCKGDGFPDAGTHFNPGGTLHPNHAGDLPPLLADYGRAYLRFLIGRFRVGEVLGNLNSPKIIQRYLKSSKIKQILRKLAKTA